VDAGSEPGGGDWYISVSGPVTLWKDADKKHAFAVPAYEHLRAIGPAIDGLLLPVETEHGQRAFALPESLKPSHGPHHRHDSAAPGEGFGAKVRRMLRRRSD
jgi:hypothetical protein